MQIVHFAHFFADAMPRDPCKNTCECRLFYTKMRIYVSRVKRQQRGSCFPPSLVAAAAAAALLLRRRRRGPLFRRCLSPPLELRRLELRNKSKESKRRLSAVDVRRQTLSEGC